jgi:signal transduction histidine kinase
MGSSDIANGRPYHRSLKHIGVRPTRRRAVEHGSGSEDARALLVVVPVGVAGVAAFVAAVADLVVHTPSAAELLGMFGLLAAAIAAEAFPLPIEFVTVGETSLAIVFIVATAVLYGWSEAALVGGLTMAVVELGWRRPFSRVVFNTGLYTCAAILAGVAAATVGGEDLGSLVGGACLASLAFYAVDMLFLSAIFARTSGESIARALVNYVYSTGLPFLVMASLSITLVLLWDRSPLVSVVVVGPMITLALYERSLHRALERLREFDRLKDEFIAVISHELRTPLTSVYGAALTLQQRHVDDPTRRELLAIVSDEAGRLARLLDDALSASRLHADREMFDIAPVDATEIARAVVDAAQQRLPQGIDVALVSSPDLPPVLADPDKLRQVLVNLTENAIKYSPDGGHVEVRVERADGLVRFSVRDEGIGIALKEQARIFERFHRLDPNMTRGVGGTGLGLYICREIVQRMAGRIWVDSREGLGSTFTFDLPAAVRELDEVAGDSVGA